MFCNLSSILTLQTIYCIFHVPLSCCCMKKFVLSSPSFVHLTLYLFLQYSFWYFSNVRMCLFRMALKFFSWVYKGLCSSSLSRISKTELHSLIRFQSFAIPLVRCLCFLLKGVSHCKSMMPFSFFSPFQKCIHFMKHSIWNATTAYKLWPQADFNLSTGNKFHYIANHPRINKPN